MMVAKLPALTPTASRQAASGGEPAHDGEAFASVLNQKKAALPERTQAGLPSANRLNAQATRAALGTEKESSDSVDEEEWDATLLALLNITPPDTAEVGKSSKAALPSAKESDEAAPPAASSDAQPLPLPALAAAVPSEAEPARAPEPLDATPALNLSDALPPATSETGSRPALPARFSAVLTQQPEMKQTDSAEPIPSAALTPLSSAAPSFSSTALSSKGNLLTAAEEPQARQPEPTMPLLATQQASTARESVPAQSSAHLTETMGTPAWQQSLGQQIACFTRNGVQHAELRLHPEELGSLQITLQLKNEQAQLHFVSGSHQVRAAIEAAVPHLRTSLAEAGIELGQSSVGADTASSWQHAADHSSQHSRQKVAEQTPQDERALPEERSESIVRTAVYNNGINTFV